MLPGRTGRVRNDGCHRVVDVDLLVSHPEGDPSFPEPDQLAASPSTQERTVAVVNPGRSRRLRFSRASGVGGSRVVWMVGAGSLVLLVFMVLGLVDLFKQRSSMSTGQTVGWALFFVIVPLIGLFSYLFWRISRSDAMEDSIAYNDRMGGSSRPLPPRGN